MPHTHRRIKHQAETKRLCEHYMNVYDLAHTGTLSRAEVKQMVNDIMIKAKLDISHTDEEVETIMRCGGPTAHAEITAADLPMAIAIAHAVRDDDKAFHQLFLRFDRSNTGHLDTTELTNLLKEVNGGLVPSSNDVDYILKQCEPRGAADPIPESQLKCAVACWYCLSQPASEKIKEMFAAWDTHKTGFISKDELAAVMKHLSDGKPVSGEDVTTIFNKVDSNHDGKIQYTEFVEWVMAGGASSMGGPSDVKEGSIAWSSKLVAAPAP